MVQNSGGEYVERVRSVGADRLAGRQWDYIKKVEGRVERLVRGGNAVGRKGRGGGSRGRRSERSWMCFCISSWARQGGGRCTLVQRLHHIWVGWVHGFVQVLFVSKPEGLLMSQRPQGTHIKACIQDMGASRYESTWLLDVTGDRVPSRGDRG